MADNENRNDEQEETPVRSRDTAGYCPYTENRRCRTGRDGGFKEDEECLECGWRAW